MHVGLAQWRKVSHKNRGLVYGPDLYWGPVLTPSAARHVEVPSASLHSLPSASPSALILSHFSKGENFLSPLEQIQCERNTEPAPLGEDLEPKKASC